MKYIVALLVLPLLLLQMTVSSALAAPGATLSTDAARKYVFLGFSGLKDVSKVSYTLMYGSNGITRGFEGLIRPKKFTSRTTKKQILGTCSSGKCVFHKNVKNLQLDVTFTLRSGKTVSVTKNLP